MKIVRNSVIAACIATSLSAPWWRAPAYAHSWYPPECCSGQDCAPVESMTWLVLAGGELPQLVVTSKHGTVIVPHDFPVRP